MRRLALVVATICVATVSTSGQHRPSVPSFETLLAHRVALKPELVGVHPRVFVTAAGLERLRQRAHTTHHRNGRRC